MLFKRKKLVLMIMAAVAIPLLFFASPVSAAIWDGLWSDAGGDETVEFLNKYEDYLSYGSYLTVMAHTVGWWFVKGLYLIVSLVEGLIPETFNLLDFLESAGLNDLTSSIINDLVVVLMVLVIVFLGIKTIIAKNPPNFKSVGTNIAISGILIVGLPSLMTTMENVSTQFYDATQTGDNNADVSSLSWGLIQDNTTDLLYIASVGFSTLDSDESKKNNLTPDSMKYSNLNALLTPDVISDAEGDEIKHLEYKLDTDENGDMVADKIKGGAFSFFSDKFDEGYFRYHVNFLPIFVGLLGLLAAYIFTLFVFVTTIIEIGFKQVMAVLVFATDIETGQKTKMVMRDILNAFLLIAFTGLSFRMYTIFLSYLATSGINIVIYLIAIVSGTFILIKGSSTIMKYFGIDVGLKEGFGQLAGAFAAGRLTAKGAKSGLNGFKKLAKGFGNGGDSGSQDNLQQQVSNERGLTSINGSNSVSSLGSQRSAFVMKPMKSIANGMNSIKDGLKGRNPVESLSTTTAAAVAGDGIGKSINTGMEKMDSEEQVATVNDNAADKGLNKSLKENINSLDQEEIQTATQAVQSEKNVDAGVNPVRKIDDSVAENGKLSQSNEQILTRMKLEDAMDPKSPNAPDTTAKVKLDSESPNPTLNSSTQQSQGNVTDTKLNPALNEKGEVSGEMKIAQTKINSDDTAKISDSESTQRVTPKVEHPTFSESGVATQKVQKEVNAAGHEVENIQQKIAPEMEKTNSSIPEKLQQKIVQEVQKANTPAPEKMQQDIMQALTKARVPQDARDSVQKVIQEVQSSNTSSPDTLKTKVIQELQGSSFGSKEPIKQMIIQDVQKAITPTPEAIEQQVNQTVNTNETKHSVANVESKTTQATEQKRYFGNLGREFIDEKPVKKTSSRFDSLRMTPKNS